MYLGGKAGTGKSTVIRAIRTFFDKAHCGKMIKFCAPTGTAANEIHGSTIHSLLGFRKDKMTSKGRLAQNISSKYLKVLQRRWRHV